MLTPVRPLIVTFRFLCLAAALVASIPASAAGLDSLTNSETVTGLKDALVRGADIAVSQLGQKDGYLDNKRVRIPLPEPLQSAEKAMRAMGMKKQAEELAMEAEDPVVLAETIEKTPPGAGDLGNTEALGGK